MLIQEKIEIAAPLNLVWQVFSTLADWGAWNTVCRDCCIIEGEGMAPGTCFFFYPAALLFAHQDCSPNHQIWLERRCG
jgi:hypothetical protein